MYSHKSHAYDQQCHAYALACNCKPIQGTFVEVEKSFFIIDSRCCILISIELLAFGSQSFTYAARRFRRLIPTGSNSTTRTYIIHINMAMTLLLDNAPQLIDNMRRSSFQLDNFFNNVNINIPFFRFSNNNFSLVGSGGTSIDVLFK